MTTMIAPELDFRIEGAEPVAFAAAPLLALKLALSCRGDQAIHSILLRCQVQIEATRRSYRPAEQEKMSDLFGPPADWDRTLRNLLWTHASISVPGFVGARSLIFICRAATTSMWRQSNISTRLAMATYRCACSLPARSFMRPTTDCFKSRKSRGIERPPIECRNLFVRSDRASLPEFRLAELAEGDVRSAARIQAAQGLCHVRTSGRGAIVERRRPTRGRR